MWPLHLGYVSQLTATVPSPQELRAEIEALIKYNLHVLNCTSRSSEVQACCPYWQFYRVSWWGADLFQSETKFCMCEHTPAHILNHCGLKAIDKPFP